MRRELSVDVAKLLEDGDVAGLQLTRYSDWGGLDRSIARPRIQKPGLALSGFVKHVYADRLQVLGLTEIDYLLSNPPEQTSEGLEAYMAKEVCAMVVTRGLEPPAGTTDRAPAPRLQGA